MDSLITRTNLPEQFGLTVLLIALVLALAPWISGVDFGFLKIPQFPIRTQRMLRIIGPIILIFAISIHMPIFPSSTDEEGETGIPSSLEEIARDSDLRELIVGFTELIPEQVETSVGLKQYHPTLRDDCTLVLRNRNFNPITVKMDRYDTYTIDFSNIIVAEEKQKYGLPGVALRFFEGRGAKLERWSVNQDATNPFQTKKSSVLIVEFPVNDVLKATIFANELAKRCVEQ